MKFPVLMSYAMIRDDGHGLATFRRFVESPHVEILLDSGAFTALNTGEEIPLGEYVDFLGEWGPKLFGYMALDKLGDAAQTERNLSLMHAEGLKPIPVHVRGDDGARMDDLFAMSSYVALGGLRRPHAGWCSPDYIKQKMEWAKGRQVHWLGYTKVSMLRAFRPFSCDSSNWAAGSRWGNAMFYHGDWRWSVFEPPWKNSRLAKKRSRLTRSEVAIAERLGFSPPWVDKRHWVSSPSSTNLAFMVGAWSHVLYAREARKRIGTRVFLAVAAIGDQCDALLRMIEETA